MRLVELLKLVVIGTVLVFNCHFASSTESEAAKLMMFVPRISPLPLNVDGCTTTSLDLTGIWQFNPAPAPDFYKNNPIGWAEIQVPSEWVMQNFLVSKNATTGYSRLFTVPSDWKAKRIKLRCNAIYSDATLYVNGHFVGSHKGGFTPFELDVTDFVLFNQENKLSVAVKNETMADTLASGSQYACHQLGGINRKLKLVALPVVNVSALYVKTKFDPTFTNASLELQLGITNEGKTPSKNISAQVQLTGPDGKTVSLVQNNFALTTETNNINLPIVNPLKWDNEHPNLYVLSINLLVDGKIVETLQQKVGFRQVEIRNNEMFVNGLPIKLRGSNHHEVYPTTGRSLPDGIALRDIQLFREGNVNLLRTCHYPPDETLLHAADSLGMFIECEAPFCWAPGEGYEELVCRQSAEMVVAYRNHPSVLFWSLANESSWGKHFESSSQLVRALDPTRPQTFNWMDSNIQTSEEEFTEIANIHYPVHTGPSKARNYQTRPVYLGEDCHLNAYNRLELATDPGLRDIWGRYLREMWDDIDSTKGCLGQSIWSGIDDTFYMPNGDVNGYGTWGPIDGWRRPKPEYWGMKKGYSPVRILNSDNVLVQNKTIKLHVQNRQNFANFAEMKLNWSIGSQKGTATAQISPNASGEVLIRLFKAPKVGEKLALSFVDPRGFIADEFLLPIQNRLASQKTEKLKLATTVIQSSDTLQIQSGNKSWKINKKTGQLTSIANVTVRGPHLMVLALNSTGETQMTGPEKAWTPYTETCTKWECESTNLTTRNDTVFVTVKGKYAEASGKYTFAFANGKMNINYQFTMDKKINPRQIGIVFSVPAAYEHLSWERNGYWDVYPADHIARLKGSVSASEGFAATSVGPRTKPSHPWRLDNLPYGNNDFCSTKSNVIAASVTDANGNGLLINGKGKQHVRCWKEENEVSFLIANYSNGGSERFLRGLANKDDKPLAVGDKITGSATIQTTIKIR